MPLRVALVPIWDVAPYYAAEQQGYLRGGKSRADRADRARRRGRDSGAWSAARSIWCTPTARASCRRSPRGIDLRIVIEGAPIGSRPPDPGALLKRKGEPLKTGKDLEGKVIGVNALRDVQWMLVTAWVKATGGDPDKVQIIEVPLPAMVDAIKAKRVDAALVLDPFMTMGLADPAIELLDWAMSRVYPGGPVAFFAITPELAAQPAERYPRVRARRTSAARRGATPTPARNRSSNSSPSTRRYRPSWSRR